MSKHNPKKISDRAREVAAGEVRSLLKGGYRCYGSLRLKMRESYFFRHQTNGNKAVVVLTADAVDTYINGNFSNSSVLR